MRDKRFAFSESPLTRSMSVIGTKWKPIIIHAIQNKKVRFGQLAISIPLITRKVLAEQLKELEEDGVLLRVAFHEIPPRVEYSLTQKGIELLPIFNTIITWSLEHVK